MAVLKLNDILINPLMPTVAIWVQL